ncbi:MAG: amidase [Gammaproteobacteria bacterium]|nr:MAG: amidase [Gammaproteobacteria bacterium]
MKFNWLSLVVFVLGLVLLIAVNVHAAKPEFRVEEATLEQIQKALLKKQITTVELVNLYLKRIKAYNGTCVMEPEGVLGPVLTIANAGQINALSTLNLRPATRETWGFDSRKARSMTDSVDNDPGMLDALEIAALQDKQLAKTGKLVGPMHGMILAVKDQFDTRVMRTTSGADAPYANDRPPTDSTFVTKLEAAGAITLAKANMGEYAGGDRSSFGGTFCNPYDTERSPGRSSGGSASAVAANLVTCAIGEESGPSVRNPAKNNNVVGLAPTQELVSRAGMIRASAINDRVGPLCRTVQDVAKILDVIAGYDPKDELTAFAVDRLPAQKYQSFTTERSLQGIRIGVVREFMNRELFSRADDESIAIVEREVEMLKKLGATVIDPGPGGALFQGCVKHYAPIAYNSALANQFPDQFPVDPKGKPSTDHIPVLLAMADGSVAFPESITIRGLGTEPSIGEGRYVLDAYLKERGDANIKTTEDLIKKSRFFTDVRPGSGFSDKKAALQAKFDDKTLDMSNRMQTRFALQQIVLQCMAQQNLQAVTYPTGNVPAPKLGAPAEPSVNGRSPLAWTLLGANGFPAISVPAGFTTEVYDRIPDPKSPKATLMVGPVKAQLPVNIDFLGRPFSEPVLLKIAAAYEAASKHRKAPQGFGALQ